MKRDHESINLTALSKLVQDIAGECEVRDVRGKNAQRESITVIKIGVDAWSTSDEDAIYYAARRSGLVPLSVPIIVSRYPLLPKATSSSEKSDE